MTANQQFCLRWNNYQTNLLQVFEQLLREESFVDVSLACEGHQIKAHRMVLSACSPYFSELLSESICSHPIIILQGVKWPELKAVVEFMYRGEINICQDQLGGLLKVAESLKIRGLADVDGEQAELTSPIPSPQTRIRSFPDDEPSLSSVLAAAARKRRRLSGDDSRPTTPMTPNSGPELLETSVDLPVSIGSISSGRSSSSSQPPHHPLGSPAGPLGPLAAHLPGHMPPPGPPIPGHLAHLPPLSPLLNMHALPRHHAPDDYEIRPGIAEMIREEERRRRDAPDMAKLLESSHHWMSPSMADAGGGAGGGGAPVFPSMFPEALTTTSHSSHHQEQRKQQQQPLSSVIGPTHTSPQSSSGQTTAKSPNTPSSSSSSSSNVPTLDTTINSVAESSYHGTTSMALSATSMDPNVMNINSSTSSVNGIGNNSIVPSFIVGDQDLPLSVTGHNCGQLDCLRGAAACAAPKSGVSRWTQSDLLSALTLVRAGTPIKPAAERCNIPVMTLWRRTRALGIVSSKVQCGFRYPAARRRSRTEPDHSTRLKLINQYGAHSLNSDLETGATLTNASTDNIPIMNTASGSIETDIIETTRFCPEYSMPNIEDDCNTNMFLPYPRIEVPSDDIPSSTYNGTNLYNAYMNRSPSVSLQDNHQSQFAKENSPFKQRRENSPIDSDRENSNVCLLKENSPRPVCRENSPLRVVKDCPKRLLKENSPLPSGRENSPIRSLKEMSPRPMLRENSPRPHNKPSTSHSQTTKRASSPKGKPLTKMVLDRIMARKNEPRMVFTIDGRIVPEKIIGKKYDHQPEKYKRDHGSPPRPLPRAPLPNSAVGSGSKRKMVFTSEGAIVPEKIVGKTHDSKSKISTKKNEPRMVFTIDGKIVPEKIIGTSKDLIKPKKSRREASPRPPPRAPLPNSANNENVNSDRFQAWVDVVLDGAEKNGQQQDHPQDLSNHRHRHTPTPVTSTPLVAENPRP